jgi:GR25 family glycosyltransferase involved in LPS biosynthesis
MFHTRLLDTKKKADSFANADAIDAIQRVYVINLDRKPDRWHQVSQELDRIKIRSGTTLSEISRRYSAIDARYLNDKIDEKMLIPYFSLADQLFVEPNPLVQIDANSKALRIKMTPQEIAIALSHIEIWKLIAASNVPYTLILEDDVYFCRGFVRNLDAAWTDVIMNSSDSTAFDLLFLSFQEVGAAPKFKKPHIELVRKPDRGIWQASGYVLSQEGAQKLLKMLPVYGPIDLWLNLQFDKLDVYLTKYPIIEQRVDVPSTNSYSVMPILSQIGVHTNEKPLVAQTKKLQGPVFAFGSPGSGLTSLATALSVMGYTCCNDIAELPTMEQQNLLAKKSERRFNAYVNIGSIDGWSIDNLVKLHRNARLIFTSLDDSRVLETHAEQVLHLPNNHHDKWAALSSFLKCEYPASLYPNCFDVGQRSLEEKDSQRGDVLPCKPLKFDTSPWIISSDNWSGIPIAEDSCVDLPMTKPVITWRGEKSIDDKQWKLRNDTFPSNLSLFNPANVRVDDLGVMRLMLKEHSTAVRDYTSAAIASNDRFLYGKFSAEIKPSNVPGLVTGIFLHRNNPHQEIDIEFLGKDTTKMLVNVFFNPGIEGTKLEYGYRGTPTLIELGFDASNEFHQYEIEWRENNLLWRVDGCIVHRRVLWNPTPIPNLPMEFNVNLWHSRSTELAGNLDITKIPAMTEIKMIQILNFQSA